MRSSQEYRPVVVYNPCGTHSERVGPDVIDVLSADRTWGRPEVWPTLYPDPMDNAKHLAEQARGGDILLFCGGDGLANSAANMYALRPDLARTDDEPAQAVLMPAGNACDASMSVYGRDIIRGAAFLDVMAGGEARRLATIEVSQDGEVRQALGYFSIGRTAAIAQRFGEAGYRAGRPRLPLGGGNFGRAVNDHLADVRDAAVILKLLAARQAFRYQDEAGEHVSREILCANLERFAKLARFDVDNGRAAIVVEFTHKGFYRQLAGKLALEAFRSGLRGKPLAGRQFRLLSPALAQYDGETVAASAGTHFSLRGRSPHMPVLGLPTAIV